MKIKKYIGLAALVFSLTANAQTINFEDATQYKSIGVYDSWVDSPFRTGELQGNVKVITNELTEVNEAGIAPNTSGKMLAFQRSRWAGNLYGARIDLNTPIQLTPENQYVHVYLYKERPGRVMLIGLGRRTERPHQAETEQFNEVYAKEITTGAWNELVFPIKGAEGVEVHALVVVPDCESTHNLDSDFAAYIDEIEINNDPSPRFSTETYPINFEKTLAHNRDDRATNTIGFNSPSGGNQTIQTNQSTTKKVYYEFLETPFLAKAGESITTTMSFSGSWMHSYVYIDYGQDGKFDIAPVNGSYSGTDAVSFSYYDGKTYAGASTSTSATFNNPPAFTIPSTLENGFYRVRYKVDWDNIDAGGNVSDNNHIRSNGGIIVDTRVNIHNDQVKIYRTTGDFGAGLNGDILKSDGSDFSEENIPFGEPYTIKAQPAPGFAFSHVIIRHGHKLDGDSIVGGTQQYTEENIPASSFANGSYTIPAEYVDGDVSLLPYFISVSNETHSVTFGTAENGTFEIQKDGVAIASGEEVQEGTVLTVVVNPNEGYELDAITVNGEKIANNAFTVMGETTVVVTFKEISTVLNYCTYEGNSTHTGRKLNSLTLNGSFSISSIQPNFKDPIYRDRTSEVFEVNAGSQVTASVDFSGEWMHGYLYIDYNKNGEFSDEATGDYAPFNIGATGIPAADSELVTYTYYGLNDDTEERGYDSAGNSHVGTSSNRHASLMNGGSIPEFTIPATTPSGEYRARFMVAWNSIDPCGYDKIQEEGGCMLDFTIKVNKTSAIDEVEGENVVLYYANGEIFTNAEGKISVYDMAGNLVKHSEFAPVNVEGLASGVYVVRVNGKTVKFVK